jgi:hypothetical protein
MIDEPYLSVVAISRNDDRGGDMHDRMQTTLGSFIGQAEKYKLKSELVLVDYNPPSDRPNLKDSLSWPKETTYCTVRTIIVPHEVHTRYRNCEKFLFNGAVALNTGIRRARGRFILLMCIDNLFSNELFEPLTRESLRGDRFYRADRLDVHRSVMKGKSIDERLALCRDNIICIHNRLSGMPVVRKKRKHLRSENLNFDELGNRLPKLHIFMPDLMLMSRDGWHSVRGFPERDIMGLGADTLLCYMAHFAGMREEILEGDYIYHIDHDSWWRPIDFSSYTKLLFYLFPDQCALFLKNSLTNIRDTWIPNLLKKRDKVEELGLERSTEGEVWQIIEKMRNGTLKPALNNEGWGLRSEQLSEYVIVRATSDQ